jgi:hypothetical protein
MARGSVKTGRVTCPVKEYVKQGQGHSKARGKELLLRVAAIEVESLMKKLDSAPRPIRGFAGNFALDGACYFSTIGFWDLTEKFAVHSLNHVANQRRPSERVVQDILDFVDRHGNSKLEKRIPYIDEYLTK